MHRVKSESPLEHRQFALLSQASRALAEANTFPEIKDIRDKAEAVRHYAKSVALSLEMQNDAAEITLRAERKLGELLASLALRGGDRKSNSCDERLKLADLAIDHNQSARWQHIAAIPGEEFERYVAHAKTSRKEVSGAGILRVARKSAIRRNMSDTVSMEMSVMMRTPKANVGERDKGDLCRLKRYAKKIDFDDEEFASAILWELKDHQVLLRQILEPVCRNPRVDLDAAARRHALRLFAEVDQLLNTILRNEK